MNVTDINGQELKESDLAQILCEVVAIDDEGVRVRILNSEQELLVTISQDEVLGMHTSSELSRFDGERPAESSGESDGDGVKMWPME